MAIQVRIEPDISSIKAALKKLDQVSAGLSLNEVLRIYRKHARLMVQAAKAKVPVKDGVLKSSIGIKAGRRSTRSDKAYIFVGPILALAPAYHMALVEYGTHGGKGKTPYMRPAADQTKGIIEANIVADLQKLLQKKGIT